MIPETIVLTAEEARRLAIGSQLLHKPPRQPDEETMLAIFRQIGCVQIDPISVVARSPLLVLWSRMGSYDQALLDHLMWEERLLFEYWAHAASIVMVEDYPIHQLQMVNFSRGDGAWARRVREWMAVNEPFRQFILSEFQLRGPLFASEIEDRSLEPWQSSGWSNTRNVSTMLGLMWEQGDITVTRRKGSGFGLKKQWGLLEQHMPQWADHAALPRSEVVHLAAQRSLKALGVGTEGHIRSHFIRNSYPGLGKILAELELNGRVLRVQIQEAGKNWPGTWYMHVDTLSDLVNIREEAWQERTILLSPFDNLIADRERTETLFDFYYRSEIYTPKAKRQYGYYVLPVLHGDRLIGRIDPKMDRKTGTLHVHAVHQEPGAQDSSAVAAELDEAVHGLGCFLGAERIQYGENLARAWASSLRDGPC